jgi:tetratricopeptide (TPR) repeat protein
VFLSAALVAACARTISAPTRTERAGELLRLGMQQYHEGDYNTALIRFQEALETSASVDYQKGVADALNNIGTVQLRQGYYEEALVNFRGALETYRSLNDAEGIATTLLNMGSVYAAIHDNEKAIQYYEMAMESAQTNKVKAI